MTVRWFLSYTRKPAEAFNIIKPTIWSKQTESRPKLSLHRSRIHSFILMRYWAKKFDRIHPILRNNLPKHIALFYYLFLLVYNLLLFLSRIWTIYAWTHFTFQAFFFFFFILLFYIIYWAQIQNLTLLCPLANLLFGKLNPSRHDVDMFRLINLFIYYYFIWNHKCDQLKTSSSIIRIYSKQHTKNGPT